MSEVNPYQTPQTFVEASGNQTGGPFYFPVSIKKLVILFIVTFSLYFIYWFYKNWVIIRDRTQERLLPVLRTIFSIFFVYSLFKRIKKAAEKENIEQKWNAGPLATMFIVLSIAGHFVDNLLLTLLLLFLLVMPLITVQRTVNQLNNDPEGELNNKFTLANVIWILIGSLMWLIAIAAFIAVVFVGISNNL